MMTFSTLTNVLGGQLVQLKKDNDIRYIITDSRRLIASPEAVFFAHCGPNHDGHIFLSELYDQGIRNFVVERQGDYSKFREANFILVSSSLRSLQRLAAFHRSQFNPEVIGITGSNGKTIVKEWLLQLLSTRFRIAATPHSYNSQLGVPLSVWQLNENHDLGIFEAGISRPGEMEHLEKIIQPTIGIFTNIGSAHDEGFSGRSEKLKEKLRLFTHCQVLIYCKDHKQIDEAVTSGDHSYITFSWGYSKEADIYITSGKKKDAGFLMQLRFKDELLEIELPVSDNASVENLMHCITCMVYLEFSWTEIIHLVKLITPVAMRLELKKGINGCYLVDDSYNNDLAGLKIALDFLHQQKQRQKKTVILSDIFQTGKNARELYREVNILLQQHKVNRFIGIGPELSKNAAAFKIPSYFYPSTNEFLGDFDARNFNEEMILIKGARTFTFERIVNRLQEKIHGTRLEINLGSITHNLNFFRSWLKRDTKIMIMVKAFAYGSGMLEIANLLQYHKADYLGVAYTDEGVNLRQNGIHIPIMVMNPSPEGYEQLLKFHLEPEIYSFGELNSLLHFLNGRKLKVHLKLDTGMHRLGFQEDQLDELISVLKSAGNLEVASIFSHLAAADEKSHDLYTRQQAETFNRLSLYLSRKLNISPLRHLLNSAGIIRYTDYQFDMVRLGIGLYGVEPAGLVQGQLRPISTLKTIISQIRGLNAGQTVGYGRKGKATENKKIATIAIGYADGFSRFFSNGKGEVSINGKRAPVIGNVCMDMTMVDITDIEAKEGDDVVVFGEDPDILELAERIGTIPYEILTSISERVKRVHVYD